MAESKTSARRLAAAGKRKAALELRLGGMTYEVIAERIGCSRPVAWRYVKGTLDDLIAQAAETGAAVLRMELDRLDLLLTALWGDALVGNVAAVDRVLKIMERRAKLLGLDAKETRQPTEGKTLAEQFVEFTALLPR